MRATVLREALRGATHSARRIGHELSGSQEAYDDARIIWIGRNSFETMSKPEDSCRSKTGGFLASGDLLSSLKLLGGGACRRHSGGLSYLIQDHSGVQIDSHQ